MQIYWTMAYLSGWVTRLATFENILAALSCWLIIWPAMCVLYFAWHIRDEICREKVLAVFPAPMIWSILAALATAIFHGDIQTPSLTIVAIQNFTATHPVYMWALISSVSACLLTLIEHCRKTPQKALKTH